MPGRVHGQRSLVGYGPRGHKEPDTTDQLILSHQGHWRRADQQGRTGQRKQGSGFFFFFFQLWLKDNWKILYEMGIPDPLTYLLRNLYAVQEATVRTGHGTTDWFQIRKGVRQGCILSPCLFNLYAECIMWNARLDDVQAGIKVAGRNISNLRYADDTTLMAESKEQLKSLLMKVKEKS